MAQRLADHEEASTSTAGSMQYKKSTYCNELGLECVAKPPERAMNTAKTTFFTETQIEQACLVLKRWGQPQWAWCHADACLKIAIRDSSSEEPRIYGVASHCTETSNYPIEGLSLGL